MDKKNKELTTPPPASQERGGDDLTQEEIHAALIELTRRIEVCGASPELTHASSLACDLRAAIGDKWNKPAEHGRVSVRRAILAASPASSAVIYPEDQPARIGNYEWSKDAAEQAKPDDREEAPPNSLPSWTTCEGIIANYEFRMRVEAGLESLPVTVDEPAPEPSVLHRFIYEYDDADRYRSAWFLHRLEKLIEWARATKPVAEQEQAGESREARMVVVERDNDGKPTVWCDPEIVDLVAALNAAGIRTVASCSGHGEQRGNIALADGRELIIAPSFEAARSMEAQAVELRQFEADNSRFVESLSRKLDKQVQSVSERPWFVSQNGTETRGFAYEFSGDTHVVPVAVAQAEIDRLSALLMRRLAGGVTVDDAMKAADDLADEMEATGCGPCIGSHNPFEDALGRYRAARAALVAALSGGKNG